MRDTGQFLLSCDFAKPTLTVAFVQTIGLCIVRQTEIVGSHVTHRPQAAARIEIQMAVVIEVPEPDRESAAGTHDIKLRRDVSKRAVSIVAV